MTFLKSTHKLLLLAVLICSGSLAHAANGFVQIASCNSQTGALNCTPTFASNTTAGNSIVVIKQSFIVNWSYGITPTLAGSTCYPMRLADVDMNANVGGAILGSWICTNIVGGTTTGPEIFAGPVGNDFTGFEIEVSGLGAWPVFEFGPTGWPTNLFVGGPAGTSLGYGSGLSASLSTVAATTTSGALEIAYGGSESTAATSCTAGSGFTIPSGGQVASGNTLACVEYNLSSSGGSTIATMTTNNAIQYSFSLVSLRAGSIPYTNPSPPSNGASLTLGSVTSPCLHSPTTITQAFTTLAKAPNGNILMAYEQNSAGQGSGPNSVAALCYSTNGGSTWNDYAGTSFGTDCANWFPGCLFSGDRQNSDSHWFPGYNGLSVNGSTVYYTVTVEAAGSGNCVNALLSTSINSGASWTSPVPIDPNPACWISPLIFVPGGGVSSQCPTGCIIAVVDDATVNAPVLFFSTDGGNTWPTSKTVTAGSILFNQLETYMWWNGSNQLVGVARSPGQPPRTFQSTDMGTTWSGAYSNLLPNIGNINSIWTLASPVVTFPNLGDSKVSVLFADRNGSAIRLVNATINTLLNSPQSLPQGQAIATNASGNTSGYESAVNIFGNQWLFSWYGPNSSNNGQIYTMFGTYVPLSGAQCSNAGVCIGNGVRMSNGISIH